MPSGLLPALTDWLYAISTALLAPVIVLELALLAWTLAMSGGFTREYFERRPMRRRLAAALEAARQAAEPAAVWDAIRIIRHGLPARLAVACAGDLDSRPLAAKALADLESDVTGSLARLSFATRVGPMLGLMGTLIPLGPALTGLAAGNLAELSSNLVVAFTTTVVGLAISCLGYGMGLARRVWYRRDLDDLEFLIERIFSEEAA
ncbi:MAG TPA: MotA/TolQ/ExbB proton channel family protein [Pirellulales bacterium]|nr:MotA/TolQ/ExbB proton channel family protein [Pirellulales bacterium]